MSYEEKSIKQDAKTMDTKEIIEDLFEKADDLFLIADKTRYLLKILKEKEAETD